MPDYRALYSIGAWVRTVPRADLEAFARTWHSPHDFNPAQLTYADQVARVMQVPCYYAGDALYECQGLPGLWHEACLRPAAPAA